MSNMTLSEKELKIGNLLQWEDESEDIIIITGINIENESCSIATNKNELAELDEFIPILLTEERLLKLGFEKEEKIQFYQYYYLNIFSIFNDNNKFYYSADCWVHIKYIHQLQNLYHILTENELIINNLIS